VVSRGSDPCVLATTTNSRALDHHTAHTLTRNAVEQLMTAGVDRVFLKIDSTMRGSVPGQISGALAAWRLRFTDAQAIVCPAYPRMGRTVQQNRLLVYGQPVELTAIGRDPVTPVKTSEMSVLIPPTASVRVADAATEDGLSALAAAIAAAGSSVIAVGSGGLAEALADVWSANRESTVHSSNARRVREIVGAVPDPRILLLVTSLNPISHTQVAKLRTAFPRVVVVLTQTERASNANVAETLAAEFADLVERERWDMVGLIGGDGAEAALNRLGASGLRIFDSMIEGVPIGVIVGGKADGLPVFTKAGGFGAEDALVKVVEHTRRGRDT
jgi:uncharacterized protein YgbK (DUF1537 family)